MESIFVKDIKKRRNVRFPLEDKFVIKSTIAANSNTTVSLPIYLSEEDVDFITIKLKYKDGNVYKPADLFATCEIRGSDVTVANNDSSAHDFSVSIF